MTNKAIWLLSDGRSGSTWCAQVLNHAGALHVEHEPVHALFNPRLAGEPLLPSPARADLEARYRPLIADVLAGQYRTDRFAEGPRPAPGGVLLRDIHALLIAPQLLRVFPALAPVVIVRHPLDVARSKLSLSSWHWFADVEALAADPLVFANLGPLRRWVARADTLLRRYVLVWAISHRWFFTHAPAGTTVLRYPATPAQMAEACAGLLGGDPVATLHDPRFAAACARRSATDQPATPARLPALLDRLGRRNRADRRFAEALIDDFGLRWLVAHPATDCAATDCAATGRSAAA